MKHITRTHRPVRQGQLMTSKVLEMIRSITYERIYVAGRVTAWKVQHELEVRTDDDTLVPDADQIDKILRRYLTENQYGFFVSRLRK